MHHKYGFIGRKDLWRKSHFFPKPFLQKKSYLGCILRVLLEKVSDHRNFFWVGDRGVVTPPSGVCQDIYRDALKNLNRSILKRLKFLCYWKDFEFFLHVDFPTYYVFIFKTRFASFTIFTLDGHYDPLHFHVCSPDNRCYISTCYMYPR